MENQRNVQDNAKTSQDDETNMSNDHEDIKNIHVLSHDRCICVNKDTCMNLLERKMMLDNQKIKFFRVPGHRYNHFAYFIF